jgi:glutaredoxin 3
MVPVKVYTWSNCPFCVRAKNLLKQKGVPFEEIDLDGKDDELNSLRARTNFKTVPQIFVGETFVGGFTDLAALDGSGELDRMLGK